MERTFVIRAGWQTAKIHSMSASGPCIWANKSSIVDVLTYSVRERKHLFKLLKTIDDLMPFCGGITPGHRFKNRQPVSSEERRAYYDSRILRLYLNMNEHLQLKLAEEVGCQRAQLFEEIREVLSIVRN